MSVMQACISRGFLFYSNINKIISLRVSYYYVNNSRPRKVHQTLHSRLLRYLDSAITRRNENLEQTTATHSIIPAEKEAEQDADVNLRLSQCYETEKTNYQSRRTDQNDLDSILHQIHNLRMVSGPVETQMQLDIIEESICRVLHLLSSRQLLLILNKLMVIIPSRLASLKSYEIAISRLQELLSHGSLEPEQIVNLLLVTSLTKEKGFRTVSMVLKHLPDLRSLSLIEQSIVSLATFKTGVKLDRRNIRVIEDTIQSNLNCLMNDSGLFVSLLKALRFGGPSPQFNLNPLSERILQNRSQLRISLAVPVLALYAEILKSEYPVIKRLVGDSMADMIYLKNNSEDSGTENFIRGKDIARLLWATNRLNANLTREHLNAIEEFIDQRFAKLSHDPKIFCSMLLSLWMLRSPRHREIVECCFKREVFLPLLNTAPYEQARLNLLIECIQIEAPEMHIPPVFLRPIIPKPMKNCRELKTVNELIKCLESHLNLYDTQTCCPIKSIRIYGISAKHEKHGLVHIDLLNNVTCLKDTRRPNGLMNLKFRLIKAMGYISIPLQNDGVIRIESMIATIEKHIGSQLDKLEDR